VPIIGLSLDATREYVSDKDPAKGTEEEAEKATVWIIGTMSSRVHGHLRDKMTSYRIDPDEKTRDEEGVETSVNLNDMRFQVVQFGLDGWRNFTDESGGQIEVKKVGRRLGQQSYQIIDPDVLARVPGVILRELYDVIRKQNDLEETEAKNLGA